MHLRFVLLLYLLIVQVGLFAQNPQIYRIVEEKQPYSDLNECLSIWEVGDGFHLEEDYSQLNNLNEIENTEIGKSYVGRITLQSQFLFRKEWVLYLGEKRHSDFAEVLILHNNGRKEFLKSGIYTRQSEKNINEGLGSKVKIAIDASETVTLYIKIRNISGFKPQFGLRLAEPAEHEKRIKRRNLFHGVIHGIFIIMFLYNILIFVQSRDRTYLYYSAYIVSIGFNFFTDRGLFHDLMMPEHPTCAPFIFVLATAGGRGAYVQFIRHFLGMRKLDPLWDKLLRAVGIISILEWVLLTVILYISFDVSLMLKISNIVSLAFSLYTFVFVGFMVRYRNTLLKYFISGLLSLSIGMFITLFLLVSGKADPIASKVYLYVGVIGEILLFSLGLGFRMRLNEKAKRKAQYDLIKEFRRNEKLQTTVQRELEEKVSERTFEIEQQKEEILTQRDELEQQRDIVEKHNKKLTDSILYAENIQRAVMPHRDLFEENFNDFFILHKPLDIVSGDFYWLKKTGDLLYLAVADCTGHGVPGAFMSMLGMAFLNDIIPNDGSLPTYLVLDELRDRVKDAMNQENSRESTNDGMNISLVKLNLIAKTMEFSGAFGPAILIRRNELRELKGDKMPISIYVKERPFSSEHIELQSGDKLYFFSDGYKDQLGGRGFDRKFYYKDFKKLLKKHADLPMQEQKDRLLEAFELWRGTRPQVDDILVVGIKI